MGFEDCTKRELGNVTLKNQDPGSLVTKMTKENQTTTIFVLLERETNV